MPRNASSPERHGWRSGRALRSFWWCCRSSWSATACATRSTQGNGDFLMVRSALARASRTMRPRSALILRDAASRLLRMKGKDLLPLDHCLPQHTPAIHLEFEVDHRRPGKMPGQAEAGGATADQLLGQDVMEIMHG